MKKIEGFKELQKETGEVVEFNNIGAGPQVCRILGIKNIVEKEYLLAIVDVVEGEFKGTFKEQFDRNTKDDKKWPFTATKYASYKKTAEKFFAAFITSVEKSNDGYKFDWDETKLKGKLVVCNFGIEEYLSDDFDDNGDQIVKQPLKIVETRSIVAYKNGDVKIKEPKLLNLEKGQTRTPVYKEAVDSTTTTDATTYTYESGATDTDDTDDDLPF